MTRTLLEMAQAFDAIDINDLEARIDAGIKVQLALGARYQEFDERFATLVGDNPMHPTAAETVLCEMGLTSPARS